MIEKFKKFCATCGLRHPKTPKCQLTGSTINLNKDFCSHHTNYLDKCSLCGNFIPSPAAILQDGRVLCASCASSSGTCARCSNSTYCAFEQDPSPIPKVIQKEIRQGNIISVTQVRNPERVRITCQNNCPCFSEEFSCLREYGTCGKHKDILEE